MWRGSLNIGVEVFNFNSLSSWCLVCEKVVSDFVCILIATDVKVWGIRESL